MPSMNLRNSEPASSRFARQRLALVAAAVVVSVSQTPAAVNDPVTTDAGKLSGVTLTSGVRAFKGIPFGAPPVGTLRWKEPQPVAKWEGVRKADQWGHACVQPNQTARNPNNVTVDLPDSPKMSEDCLYLNVWTSAPRANARQAVMVWIFGGAYAEGGGNSPHNDGENLAKKGVVVVNFNYRLGPFGFFSHPELTKESGRNASGNQALADSIAVLRWVKTNIAAFGGDPNNVTIFGESAGAAMVGGLVGSPVAKGLFHRAISQSGAWMGLGMGPMLPRERAEQSQVIVPGARGRGRGDGPPAGPPAPPPPLPPLAELRARSAEEVTKTLRGAGMIVDGWIVPEDESITFARGRQNAVDVIAGFNKDEHSSLGGNVAFRDTMAWHMRLFVERQVAIGKRGYFYTFTHEPPIEPGARDLKATHAAEIVYAFNNLSAPRVFPDSSSPKLAMASEKDKAVADLMSTYWVNFARTGDPNGNARPKGGQSNAVLPAWPPFKDRNAPPHVIGDIKEYPSAETLNAYDAKYAEVMKTLQK
jgi:para-nitrobenzyl esterase